LPRRFVAHVVRPCHGSAATASAPSYPPDRSILPPAFSRLPASFGSPGRRGAARGMSCIAFPRRRHRRRRKLKGLKEMGFFSIRPRFQNQPVAFKRPRHRRSLTVNKRFVPNSRLEFAGKADGDRNAIPGEHAADVQGVTRSGKPSRVCLS
jgi:hypothetical protein